ncbi:MAG: hypothetical protein KA327_09260 [Pseudarcicella sp.]|nr:hypothetical protein [Pseudarcicella sp.]
MKKSTFLQRFITLSLLAFASVSTITSCEKSDEVTTPKVASADNNLKNFRIEDGKLSFKDSKEFFAMIKTLESKNNSQLLKNTKELGFISHLQVMDNLKHLRADQYEAYKNENVKQQLSERIRSPFLATLLNKDREVAIGDSICRFGADYSFKYKKGDEKAVNDFYLSLKKSRLAAGSTPKSDKFQVYVSKTSYEAIPAAMLQATAKPGAKVAVGVLPWASSTDNVHTSTGNDVILDFGNHYRAQGEAWVEYYGIGRFAGFSTQMEKATRGWWEDMMYGDWMDINASFIEIHVERYKLMTNATSSGNMEIRETDGSIALQLYKSSRNDDVVTIEVHSGSGSPSISFISYFGASGCDYKGKYLDGKFTK